MREYTNNRKIIGMNVRSTSLENKEIFFETGKILDRITKLLELMTTRTFTNSMMETMKHTIKDMWTSQKCQKPIAKNFKIREEKMADTPGYIIAFNCWNSRWFISSLHGTWANAIYDNFSRYFYLTKSQKLHKFEIWLFLISKIWIN